MLVSGGLSLLIATAVTVTVAPSEHAGAITARLVEDLGPNSVVEDGDLTVQIDDAGDALVVTITEVEVLLSRRIGLSDGIVPAIRLAALLVVEVVDRVEERRRAAVSDPVSVSTTATTTTTSTSTTTTTTTATATTIVDTSTATTPGALPSDVRRFGLLVGGSFGWWATPAAPRLGALLGARFRIAGLALGVRGGIEGLCCSFSTAGRIDGRSLRMWILAEAAYDLLLISDLRLGPVVGAGVEIERAKTTATAFAGEPVEESINGSGAVVRVGARVGWAVHPRWTVALAGGVQVRTTRLVSSLPPPFTEADPDVDGGRVLPWAEVDIEFAAF